MPQDPPERSLGKDEHAVRAVRQAIGVLAVLFAAGGALTFAMAQRKSAQALSNLAHLEGQTLLPAGDDQYTAAQVRAILQYEPYQTLIVHLLLSMIMVGLFFWATRAPLAAAGAAFGVFVILQGLNLIVDPGSLTRGLVVKVLALMLLARAVRAGLLVRQLRKSPQLPV